MNELLSKISSYNLFNYLFPGVLFAVAARYVLHLPTLQEGIITSAFLWYFLGLVISRVGSLIVEPFLKFTHFTKFADYAEFLTVSKKDEQLTVLSEVNNMYRTLCSLFSLLLLLKLYAKVETCFPNLAHYDATILVLLLLVIFLFSYRKQASYITKRIKAQL